MPQVRESFNLNDETGNLDCTVFDKAQAESGNRTFPDNFRCSSRKSSSVGSVGSLGGGQVVMMGVVILAAMII